MGTDTRVKLGWGVVAYQRLQHSSRIVYISRRERPDEEPSSPSPRAVKPVCSALFIFLGRQLAPSRSLPGPASTYIHHEQRCRP